MLFIIITFIIVISSFGPIRAKNIFYSEYVMSQRIKLAGFIEFGELFFIIQTVLGFFIKYILSTYAILLIYKEEIKNPKRFIGIYSALVFIFSNYLGLNNHFLFQALNYVQISNIICFIIIPLITFSIYRLRFKDITVNKK